MDELDIYDSVDEPSGNHSKWKGEINSSEMIYLNEEMCHAVESNRIGPVLSGLKENKTVKKSSCRAAAAILGVMCLLLLAGLLTLVFLQAKGKWNMETKEKDQLQKRLEDMSNERNDLQRKLQALNFQGWMYFSGSFYYISSCEKSWQESRTDCLQRGADLVIINNLEEQEFTRRFQKHAWIGLTHIKTERKWKWVDGTPVTSSFSYWATSEPNNAAGDEDCAEIDNYYLEKNWNDASCSHQRFWICEKMLPQ